MIATTLSSLALLKARFEIEQIDHIESFIPFIENAIELGELIDFDAEELKPVLEDEFGLLVPQYTIDLVCNRMKKRGFLKRDQKKFSLVKKSKKIEDFKKDRSFAIKHQNATIKSLIEHTQKNLNIDLSNDEAIDSIYRYIDQYCIECVEAYECSSVVPIRGQARESWRFIVSSYVNSISEKDPAKFEYFLTTVKGRMLANALIGKDLGQVKMKFKATTIFIDTPILLQLLGVLGYKSKDLVVDMIKILIKAKAKLGVFRHNLEELNMILKNAAKELEYSTGGYGNVILSLREIGKNSSDITLLRSQVEEIIASHSIEIFSTPEYEKSYQIDEKKLETEMKNAGLFYRNIAAKKADINSVRSIFVLRRNYSPKRIENCRAILLTNNSALSRAAYSYGANHDEIRSVTAIITDYSLVNIVWLKSPMESNDLPENLMVANCFAALRPSDKLWSGFISEIANLKNQDKITAEQHLYLRYELRVREELMNFTLGDEASLNEKQIFQILDRHEQDIARPWKDRYEEIKETHEKTTDALEETATKLSRVNKSINKIGAVAELIIKWGLIIPCVILIFYAIKISGKSPMITTGEKILYWVKIGTISVLNISTVLNLMFGFIFWNPISIFARFSKEIIVKGIKDFIMESKNK